MTNSRRKLSQAEEVALLAQVDSHCPLCQQSLFYVKHARSYKEFDFAHIYPLNPSHDETTELAEVERLHEDVNHVDNLVPLCCGCHTRFDKPRTRNEYNQLMALKKRFLERARQYLLVSQYQLESEIKLVLLQLAQIDESDLGSTTDDFTVKRTDDKFDESLSPPTRRKINHAVTDYYNHVRKMLNALEMNKPSISELIRFQVRAFYMKQKSLQLDQQTIFQNVVDWIGQKGASETCEPAEVVASYFIQSCDVFE